jgi:hypothetical protein
MPCEGFPRKCEKAASRRECDFILLTPDEPTPAMRNPEKDPEDRTTGEEPMTGPRRSTCKR